MAGPAKTVVKKAAGEDKWLNKNGNFGARKAAKVFDSKADATRAVREKKLTGVVYEAA